MRRSDRPAWQEVLQKAGCEVWLFELFGLMLLVKPRPDTPLKCAGSNLNQTFFAVAVRPLIFGNTSSGNKTHIFLADAISKSFAAQGEGPGCHARAPALGAFQCWSPGFVNRCCAVPRKFFVGFQPVFSKCPFISNFSQGWSLWVVPQKLPWHKM